MGNPRLLACLLVLSALAPLFAGTPFTGPRLWTSKQTRVSGGRRNWLSLPPRSRISMCTSSQSERKQWQSVHVARACRTSLKAMPPKEQPFKAAALRSEAENMFSKSNAAILGTFTIGSVISLFFVLPRLVAAQFGIKSNTQPISGSNELDVIIGLGGALVFGALTKREFDMEASTQERMEEAALVAKLVVEFLGPVKESVRLGNLRQSRAGPGAKRRVVLCIGSEEFCTEAIEAAMPHADAIARAGFLLVPVPIGAEGLDATALVQLVKRAAGPWEQMLPRMAFPRITDTTGSDNWNLFCKTEVDRANEQDLNPEKGLLVVVRTNGRIGLRLKGSPDWKGMAAEASSPAAKRNE
eukprot:TRINITY_DN27180_c0_g1_i1.p1 TRINITY_DN27180_c0_g1~~TRINITY_DN27180_c0_g1_i1.p1  ORF type:complete len:363 (-),score=58.79 TRINITY_DN27180_c0_g1_i1:50-1114(-)